LIYRSVLVPKVSWLSEKYLRTCEWKVFQCSRQNLNTQDLTCVWNCILQWEYNDWIADQCGFPYFEEWRKQMYLATGKSRALRPESYRDEWEDDDLVQQAEHDFANYLIW